jgi:polyphosphate kinase 2
MASKRQTDLPTGSPTDGGPRPAGRAPRARAVADGDTGPLDTPESVERFAVAQNAAAAELAQVNALEDILSGRAATEATALMKMLLKQQQARAREEPTAPDDELSPDWRKGGYPYKNLLSRKGYEKQKYRLQVELLKLQSWVKDTGQRVAILFEGRDAAGKGGTIKRFMENLNPRGARVVALEKPTEVERGQWYFQRYIQHLPAAGEIVLFDRSWYNRAGVERVMGFCEQQAYLEFMRQTPELERMLVRSGLHLIKFWFSVSRDEQRRRFKEREKTGFKRFKITEEDWRNRDKWDAYQQAAADMIERTSTETAPWTLIEAEDKNWARIKVVKTLAESIEGALSRI